jgi:hypothetical protein
VPKSHRIERALEDGTGQIAIFFALPEDRNDEERPVATNKPTEFAADSALEGSGFELSVPLSVNQHRTGTLRYFTLSN